MIPDFRRQFDFARDPVAAQYALNIGKAAAWTPTLTFATPGDLSVAYTTRLGTVLALGATRIATFNIQTSTFTHTTASGALQITGLPIASASTLASFPGFLGLWQGITKATYTEVAIRLNASSTITFVASGSGVAASAVTAADTPTGGTVTLRGQIIYHIS